VVQHEYIRHNKNVRNEYTSKRMLLRVKSDHSTRTELISKYGAFYKTVLRYGWGLKEI